LEPHAHVAARDRRGDRGRKRPAALGLVDLSKTIYTVPRFTWLSYILGGLLFGIGMTLGSGCGSRR